MISVAMTTYNGQRYIKEQLDSILNQSVSVDEIIVCDDGSTDQTIDILSSYKEKYPQIHYYQNKENLGYKLNFKKAMELCSGDYIFLCDQDDIWMNNKVEVMLQTMNQNSNIKALASSFIYIDAEDKKIDMPQISGRSNNNLYLKPVKDKDCVEVKFEEFYNYNCFQGCSLLLKKELKDKVVNYFTTIVPHDYLINFTAAKEKGMYFLNVPLFQYRLHENNTIGVNDDSIGFIQKMKNRNTYPIRAILAEDGIRMIEALKETDPTFYNQKKDYYDKKWIFYKEHTKYLKERKFFGLLFENKNPYYKEFKSFKARMMDLVYAILG